MKEFDKLNILYLCKEDEEKFLSNEFLLSVDDMISINPEIEKFIKKGEIGTIPSFSFMHKEIKKSLEITNHEPVQLLMRNNLPKSYRVVIK